MFEEPTNVAPGESMAPVWHSAYIAPDGTFHYVPTHGHCYVGPSLHHRDGSEHCRFYSDCDTALKVAGYIHWTEGWAASWLRPLTYQQRATLEDAAYWTRDNAPHGYGDSEVNIGSRAQDTIMKLVSLYERD